MFKLNTFLVITLLLLNFDSTSNTHPKSDHRITISLSYDDALESQLDYAIPSLNKYNIKGSFYLVITHPSVLNRLDEWRAAAAQGHELGNHTLFHSCSKSKGSRDWVLPHHDLDAYTLPRLVEEITACNTFLHAIDGKTERTFTPPCLDSHLGDVNYLDSIKPLFTGIKTYGFDNYDSFGFNDGTSVLFLPDGNTAQELIDYVETASKKYKDINILFHGIGGDYSTVAADEHENFIKYLSEHQDIYYVDTFLNICKAKN